MTKPEKPEARGRRATAEVTIDASAETVWEAWTRPDRIVNWFVDHAAGDMNVDPSVEWGFEGFGDPFPVTVFETDAPRYLAIGGPSPVHEGVTILQEITLQAREGKTVLRIVQSGFLDGAEWDDEVTDIGSGWMMAFALLKEWLQRYPGASRTRRLLLKPVVADAATIRATFHASALATWWGAQAPLGDVLVDTGTEVTVAWPEHSAAIGLKNFAAGDGRVVALDFNTWGTTDEVVDALVPELRAALDRLADSLND